MSEHNSHLMGTMKITLDELQRATAYGAPARTKNQLADKIAQEIFKAHHPEHFTVHVVTPLKDDAEVTLELSEKKINDEKGHHVLTFSYEVTRGGMKVLESIVESGRDNDMDEDDLEELDTITRWDGLDVMAEITSRFEKVWGHLNV